MRFTTSTRPIGRRTHIGRLAALAAVMVAVGTAWPATVSARTQEATSRAATTHTVSYDHYSFIIDGRRTYLWSGEFHYFRLPSPDLWRDIFQKMRAAGFNAVSLYFDWGYHSRGRGSMTSPASATSTSCSTWPNRPGCT